MGNFEILSLISAFGIPLLGLMLARQDRHREFVFKSIDGRLIDLTLRMGHMDECVDELKVEILAKMASKSDLVEHRSMINSVIIREREITSQDTGGLEKRIFRLEDRGLVNGSVGLK